MRYPLLEEFWRSEIALFGVETRPVRTKELLGTGGTAVARVAKRDYTAPPSPRNTAGEGSDPLQQEPESPCHRRRLASPPPQHSGGVRYDGWRMCDMIGVRGCTAMPAPYAACRQSMRHSPPPNITAMRAEQRLAAPAAWLPRADKVITWY